jgi:hypothetical protein
MRRDAILLVVGLAVAFLPSPALLISPMGLLVPAGLFTMLWRRYGAGVPSWAMWVWFLGALWVGFIGIFGGWFVSQM